MKEDKKSPIGLRNIIQFNISDEELDEAIKGMTKEELVRIFVEMLKKDANRADYIFQFLTEVVNSSAAMGQRGFQPITAFTLYARESMGVTEFKFRSAGTGSTELHQRFKLGRLIELVLKAWVEHGNETFGEIKENADVSAGVSLQ